MEDTDDDHGTNKRNINPQACETCRSRKVKCPGEQPCAVCQKLNVECVYRETKPTKKDKTLVHILDTIKSLESKVDLALAGTAASSSSTTRSSSTAVIVDSSFSTTPSNHLSPARADLVPFEFSNLYAGSHKKERTTRQNRIEARKVVSWPAVRTLLQDEISPLTRWDVESDGGERWLTNISRDFGSLLPSQEPVNFNFLGGSGSRVWESSNFYLTKSVIEELCSSFFRSFHAICPILDPGHFYDSTLAQAYRARFDEYDECSCLVLIVLALGSVAQDGLSGNSLLEASGRRTGVRGGSTERPPGLAFSNEAKKRMGFMMTRHDLHILQCFVLLAVYYSQISRNMDYWHLTAISSLISSSLIKLVDDWKTYESDKISRAYWMCVLMQGGLTSELGLSTAGPIETESTVPLPLFISETHRNNGDELFIHYNFLAQITLRSHLDRINTSLQTYRNPFQTDTSEEIPPTAVISELLRQIRSWRESLPPLLTWEDSDPIMKEASPDPHGMDVEPPEPTQRVILNASLRTRYKYAEYLIWRPYLYKVLHFPQSITADDLQGCKEAFMACSSWPLTHPIFKDQRRLIPHLYEYSHTFFGILVLLHVCEQNPLLNKILVEQPMWDNWAVTRSAMLCWMRDMQIVHPVARWGWQLLRRLYSDHELVKDYID